MSLSVVMKEEVDQVTNVCLFHHLLRDTQNQVNCSDVCLLCTLIILHDDEMDILHLMISESVSMLFIGEEDTRHTPLSTEKMM